MGVLDTQYRESLDLAYPLAQFIQWIAVGKLDLVNQWLTANEGIPDVSLQQPATPACPAYALLRVNGQGIIVICGAQTLDQAAGLVAGYVQSGFPVFNPQPTNLYLQTAATTIYSAIVAKYPPTSRFIICGHSLGGGVAYNLALKMPSLTGSLVLTVHTFGSVKPGSANAAAAGREFDSVRWFTDADPVPYIPMSVDIVPALSTSYSADALRTFGQYCHWRGGVELNINGTFAADELPDASLVTQVSTLAAWLFGWEQDPGLKHSIAGYLAFIANAINLAGQRAARNVPSVAPQENPNTLTRRMWWEAERQTFEQLTQLETQQSATPVAIPNMNAFRAIRNGRVWTIAFGEQTIAFAPSRRRARGLAAQMNDAFRRLQIQAVVDPQAFSQQLTDYFAAATTPGSGFVPVMNTQFP